MKTILLISPYWKEHHRWMVSSVKLAELWQRLGYRVLVACMGQRATSNEQTSNESTEVISPTLTIYRKKDLFLKDPWNYGIALGFGGFVRKIIQKEKPDLIVVNKILFWSSLSLLWLRLRGQRVILTTDTLVGITWWPVGKIPQIAAAIYAWTLGWLILLAAKKVVFFHTQPRSLLQKLGIDKKSVVIPSGIDVTSYELKNSQQERNPQLVTMTYVGRLESVKGVEDFLAAATTVQAKYPHLVTQVAGFYEQGNRLVRSYEKQVHFLGLRHDVPDILSKTDIFVLPSYSEGLSNALMEAMASSCACIASDVGGNHFLIQNGVSGLLFPAGDRDALAAHMRRLIEDPVKRSSLGAAARQRIEKEFEWKVIGEKYKKLFNEFMSEK